MRRSLPVVAVLSLAMIVTFATSASGQIPVMGTVVDKSGAGMPGVSVKITGVEAGNQITQTGISNEEGTYSFFARPGRYDLSGTQKGFKTSTIPGIQVGVEPTRVSFTMEIGESNDVVIVTPLKGEPPLGPVIVDYNTRGALSLNELCGRAIYIVEATVETVFPAYALQGGLYTDAQYRVTRVLKGPTNLQVFVVSQPGGVLGTRVQTSGQVVLVQPGERYLVFAQDAREGIDWPARGNDVYRLGSYLNGLMQVNAQNQTIILSDIEKCIGPNAVR